MSVKEPGGQSSGQGRVAVFGKVLLVATLVLALSPSFRSQSVPSSADSLREADTLRRAGQLAAAESLLRRELAKTPHDFQRLYLLGTILLQEHRYREAATLFRNLDAAPLSPQYRSRVLVGLGRALAGSAQPRPAVERFLRARKLLDPGAEALARLALARQQLGDLPRAARAWAQYRQVRPEVSDAVTHQRRVDYLATTIRRLRTEIESAPGDPKVALRLAGLLAEGGDGDEAIAVLQRVSCGRQSVGPGPRYQLARLLLAGGRLDEARAALRGHLNDFPHHLSGYYALAAVEASAGNRAAEARAWNAVLALRPVDRFAARSRYRALALIGSEPIEEEIAFLEQRLDETPSAEAHVLLALALQAAKRPDDALQQLVRALELAPNDNGVLGPLRGLLEGEPSRVLKAVATLTSRARTRPASLRARGVLRAAFGDASGAIEDLTLFLERFPADLRGKVSLAFAYQSAGELEPARELLEKAIEQGPAYAIARLDLAAMALSQGEPERALAEARQAGARLPLEPLAHTLAGAALLESGKVRQALTELAQALALAPVDVSGRVLPLAMRAFLLAGEPESVRLFLRGGVPLEPEQLYLIAWRYLRDAYLGEGYDPRRWLAWRDRFNGRLRDNVDAHAAIGRLAASLDDPYTRLLTRDESLTRLLADGEVLSKPPKESLDESPSLYWAVREEGVLYLRLTSLRDPAAAKAVEEVLDSFPEVEEVVLDLRGNPGGYEEQAQKIAELLLAAGEKTTRWKTRAGDKGGDGRRRGSSPRLEILVDGETGSAAEHLAEDLLAGGAARLVGGPTLGKRVAQIPFILPDGWTLLVTAARMDEPVLEHPEPGR